MPLELTHRSDETLPIELEGFTPDAFAERSVDEVRRFEAHVGNTRVAIGELFDVSGDPSDADWRFIGDLSGVHWLGAGMRSGRIEVTGDAGRHLGSGMRGGGIVVGGSASDWLGAEMRGGKIEVAGDAGRDVGAAYAGSQRGMRGGRITVHGSVGDEVGLAMRRGAILVLGDCGELVGYRMLAGTIFVFGECGRRPGAEMKRGTLGLFGGAPPALLPTFRHAGRVEPPMLRLMAREWEEVADRLPVTVDLHHGDLLTGGRGEILLSGQTAEGSRQ